jgi:cell shape-determining protein MreD
MNALLGLAILAAILYGILLDGAFWRIYGICVLVYLLFVMCATNKRDNHKRRIITLSTWDRKTFVDNSFPRTL